MSVREPGEPSGAKQEGDRSAVDGIASGLRALQSLFWTHPMAVQRAFSALVREGRAFAQTPEGAELKQRLEFSPSASRWRLVWDTLSMSAFSEDESELLPSAFVDSAAKAAQSSGLESLLSGLFIERA